MSHGIPTNSISKRKNELRNNSFSQPVPSVSEINNQISPNLSASETLSKKIESGIPVNKNPPSSFPVESKTNNKQKKKQLIGQLLCPWVCWTNQPR